MSDGAGVIQLGNVQLTPAAIEALVVLFEAGVNTVEHIITAIKSHGELTDEQKHQLITRVEAARAKVAGVELRKL